MADPPAEDGTCRNERGTRRALFAVVLVALLLRVWGITFGFPYLFHFDENNYMFSAYRLDFESFHPLYSPLFGVLQVLVVALHRVLMPLVQLIPIGSEALRETVASPTASYHLLGRGLNALLGATAPLWMFGIGRRIWNRDIGLAAAAFLAGCFLHVRSSHYAVPDATAVFLVLGATYWCTRLNRAPSFLLAGLFAGAAISAKLLSWPVVLLIPMCWLLQPHRPELEANSRRDQRLPRMFRRFLRLLDWRIVLAFVTAGVAFIALSPHVVLSWRENLEFWKNASVVGRDGGLGPFRLDEGGPLLTYWKTALWGLGAPLAILGFAGLVLGLVRPRNGRAFSISVFALVFLVFLLRPNNVYQARYLLIAVPTLLLLAAALLHSACERLPWRSAMRGRVFWGCVFLALIAPLLSSIRHNVLLGRTDTRILARNWVEANLPADSFIVLEERTFSPPLSSKTRPVPLSRAQFRIAEKRILGLSATRSDIRTLGLASAEMYRKAGVGYLVTNDWTSESRMIDAQLDQRKMNFYRQLDNDATLLKEFSPYKIDAVRLPRYFVHNYGPAVGLARFERPGPTLKVYGVAGAMPDEKHDEETTDEE